MNLLFNKTVFGMRRHMASYIVEHLILSIVLVCCLLLLVYTYCNSAVVLVSERDRQEQVLCNEGVVWHSEC